MIRLLTIEDYEDIYLLWRNTSGVGLRKLDDSREGIQRFLLRNPDTNFVAIEDGQLVGVMLSGHDGRRGFIYHACVAEGYRRRSLGRQLADKVIEAMKAEGITRLVLVAFKNNREADCFWKQAGWERRDDLYYYTQSLNDDNN